MVTQEFHLSVTPIRDQEYIVRTEYVAPGVPLAEEQVTWYVDDWLTEASLLMGDPVMGLLRSTAGHGATRPGAASSLGEPSANLVAFGQQLFNALFQGRIRDSWMMAQGIAQHQHQRLRFRLGLKGTKLHQLPWEVLYAGDRPLTTGTDVIFSRYHSSFAVLRSHLTLPKHPNSDPHQPLKILLVLSAPRDQDGLALRQEAEQLRQELRSATDETSQAGVDLTILEQPGREQLTQALEHHHFHVLHYAGHSDLGAGGGSLYLVNRQTGLTEVMSGDDLAGLLVNNGIRMAVFNSCRGVYTATSGHQQGTEGNLAESLVKRGIPAVLAMAERIPDNVALNLSRLFYRNLKQAYPLDLSLSRTRQGLLTSYGSDQLYWALPILYLHPEFDGFLQPTSVTGAIATPSTPNYSDFYTPAELPPLPVPPGGSQPAVPFNSGSQESPNPITAGRSQPEATFPEFDELEFDDPDPPEEEQVARLVQELSQSPTLLEPEEPILPASPSENLLPQATSNGQVPSFQPPTRRPTTSFNGQGSARPPTPAAPSSVAGNSQVYSELTHVLADMGTLTPAIAAGSRAVNANPQSAEAYTTFGWALHQQGYLTEAIAAYNEAIRLDSNSAIAFNRIGLAYSQQGKVEEAARAFRQAVTLDPKMTEASTNLRNVLYGQPEPLPRVTPTPATVVPAPPRRRPPTGSRQVWLWGSLGAIAIAALTAGWLYRDTLGPFFRLGPPPPARPSPVPPVDNSLNQLDPTALAAIAQQNLQQGKINEAQPAIAALLLKPDSLQAAAQILQSVPPAVATQPEMAFLRGMLLWRQRMATKDSPITIAQVRQLWDQAAQAQPTPQHYNALGFAYYAEGNIERAEQSWLRALQLAAVNPDPAQVKKPLNWDSLTAFAGLALTAEKFAERQADATQQAALRAEVLKRRQMVLANDPINFTPEKLSLQWMWSETAIQDWQKLLNR